MPGASSATHLDRAISEEESLIPGETGVARVSKHFGAARGLHPETHTFEEEHQTLK